MNKIVSLIPNPRINTKYIELGKMRKLPMPDYRLLLSWKATPITSVSDFMEKYKDVLDEYSSLKFDYIFRVEQSVDEYYSPDKISKSQTREMLACRKAIETVKSKLSVFGYTDKEIADILVKYLYAIKESKNKEILWVCYGDILVHNLERNIKKRTKFVQCSVCGEWYETSYSDHSAIFRCDRCYAKHRKERKLETQRERRAKAKENKAKKEVMSEMS